VANNWLITGTSSGFGRTLTELALERGDNVVATVRKPSALDDLKERYGNRLRVSILDVTNAKEIVSVVDGAFDALGKIDFAVSNAGYIMVGAAEEAELPRIERLLDTNLLGSIVFAKAVIPHMRKQGGGRILQISSEQSQMAYPGMSVYATTKWGIEGFFEGVIPEIAKFGIEVSLVELVDEGDEPATGHFQASLAQMQALAAHAAALISAGRPPCPMCGGPIDHDGGVCPRLNGHH